MKFAAALLLIISYIAMASAHMAMLSPVPRGGVGTKQYNGRVHVRQHPFILPSFSLHPPTMIITPCPFFFRFPFPVPFLLASDPIDDTTCEPMPV